MLVYMFILRWAQRCGQYRGAKWWKIFCWIDQEVYTFNLRYILYKIFFESLVHSPFNIVTCQINTILSFIHPFGCMSDPYAAWGKSGLSATWGARWTWYVAFRLGGVLYSKHNLASSVVVALVKIHCWYGLYYWCTYGNTSSGQYCEEGLSHQQCNQ